MAATPDYYEVLQVSPNADGEVIQAAYKRLAYKWHPDRRPGDPSAAERMKLLNEANEVLSNPHKRQVYDSQRGRPTTGGVTVEVPSPATAEGQQGRSSTPPAGSTRTEWKPPPKKESEWSKLKAGVITLLSLMAAGAPLQCSNARRKAEHDQVMKAKYEQQERERYKRLATQIENR